MDIWNSTEIIYILLIFVWTGFVRTGLGFGGAALGLPLLLFVGESPVYWLPIIGIHLLFFTTLSFATTKIQKRSYTVDVVFLKKNLIWIIIPALLGVFGLITFSPIALIIFVYSIAIFYSLIWMLDKKVSSDNTLFDKFLLLIGGYVAGISLTGAPLIVVVAMRHVSNINLRDTLFVLWFILVGIKMITFVIFGIYIDVWFAIYLLPIALIGHLIGLKAHSYIIKNDMIFKRIMGGVLFIISVAGLIKMLV